MAGNHHIRQLPTGSSPSTHTFAVTLHDSHGGGSARDGGEGEEASAAMTIACELETAEQVSHYTVVLLCHTQNKNETKSVTMRQNPRNPEPKYDAPTTILIFTPNTHAHTHALNRDPNVSKNMRLTAPQNETKSATT